MDKNKTYVVYCKVGGRSKIARKLMHSRARTCQTRTNPKGVLPRRLNGRQLLRKFPLERLHPDRVQ